MTPEAAIIESSPPAATVPPAQRAREVAARVAIDDSTKMPVLAFYSTALIWLMVSSFMSLICAIKLHSPEFLGDWSFISYARLRPAQWNIFVYGWASLAGMGTAIWLMARLTRVALRHPVLVVVGMLLWNLGVLVGTVAILAGDTTSLKYLEYPPYASFLLFFGYLAIGVWAVIMYRSCQPGTAFITQYYILAAFFAFPWLYATANLMAVIAQPSGVLQSLVHWWYGGNLFGLWLTALGLGTAYYLIPKVIGRPIYSYHLATFGFWTFVLFYSWRGMQEMIGAPLPAWVVTAGIVATILTIIPVATVALNHHMTMRDHFPLMHKSPTLRFVVLGSMAYTFASLLAIVLSLRMTKDLLQFTHAYAGQYQLETYAFFTMVMFGAMYYIVPRLVGCEWRSAWLIKLHFWGAAYGIGLTTLMLFSAGFVQGAAWGTAESSPSQVVEGMLPLMRGRTIGEIMLLIGHSVFLFHFLTMLFRAGLPSGTPTLIEEGGH